TRGASRSHGRGAASARGSASSAGRGRAADAARRARFVRSTRGFRGLRAVDAGRVLPTALTAALLARAAGFCGFAAFLGFLTLLVFLAARFGVRRFVTLGLFLLFFADRIALLVFVRFFIPSFLLPSRSGGCTSRRASSTRSEGRSASPRSSEVALRASWIACRHVPGPAHPAEGMQAHSAQIVRRRLTR